jgi:hypothetical protein
VAIQLAPFGAKQSSHTCHAGPRDARRALADPKWNLRLFVSLDGQEQLIDAAIGVYDGTPHEGLNGRTPLETIECSVRGRGLMLNCLPEEPSAARCA